MAHAITIDNYDMKAHERYATDRESLEMKYVDEASEIPKHLEGAYAKTTLTSKWEELFETHLHRHPFAHFAPPPNYWMMRNRFFSYSLSPDFDWTDNEEDEEEQKEKERHQAKAYKRKIQAKERGSIPSALFEKDRSILLNLVDSIQSLNDLLREIHARKIQYQKG